MKVAILVLGTRGDLELFLGLGRALVDRGHAVTLGVSGYHVPRAQASGLRVVAMNAHRREGAVDALRALAPMRDRLARTRAFYRNWLRGELQLARPRFGALVGDAGYVVSNLKLPLRRDGERIPGAFVDYDPPVDLNAFARLGIGSAEHRHTTLDLVALSQDLVDPDRRWPAQYRFTGFWQGGGVAAPPSPQLESFIEGGTAPVVVTLGSMVMFDPAILCQLLIDAMRLIGRRAVVVGGWSDLAPQYVDDRLLVVPEASYDWLFPRAACVVHHGGTGTVAAAIRAGRVSVVLPQIACQEEFARILVRADLASAALDLAVDDHRALARAVDEAVGDPRRTRAAAAWSAKLESEPGVAGAVSLIEAHAAKLEAGPLPRGGAGGAA